VTAEGGKRKGGTGAVGAGGSVARFCAGREFAGVPLVRYRFWLVRCIQSIA